MLDEKQTYPKAFRPEAASIENTLLVRSLANILQTHRTQIGCNKRGCLSEYILLRPFLEYAEDLQ